MNVSMISGLPMVVQIGFAGPRRLFDDADVADAGELLALFEQKLTQRIATLRSEFDLQSHFLCGISQLAVGADMVFARACRNLNIPQRVFLPQPREEFLNAVGSSGADFSDADKALARAMFAEDHIIQERVVSSASQREERFEDANLEIIRVSDLLVCVERKRAETGRGGTRHAIDTARKRGIPVLVIEINGRSDSLDWNEEWYEKGAFRVPQLPPELARANATATPTNHEVPDLQSFLQIVKDHASGTAKWQRALFEQSALLVIGAHILATVAATLALAFHEAWALPWLLAFELLCLGVGFQVHHHLHASRAREVWSISRVVAEVTRSLGAMLTIHVYLEHLFALPYPPALRPLLRTLSVLHLRSSRREPGAWQSKRDTYLKVRVMEQIDYFEVTMAAARRSMDYALCTFVLCTGLAVIATSAKLLVSLSAGWFGLPHDLEELTTQVLGAAAITLPVLAVAALSLAGAFDREARFHTHSEMFRFLTLQRAHIERAQSEREFVRLLLETESRLLGENANWYARRSFTGVA